jgi:hypothetical protein
MKAIVEGAIAFSSEVYPDNLTLDETLELFLSVLDARRSQIRDDANGSRRARQRYQEAVRP